MTGQAHTVQGDALHLPLPDESVDLVVTSPPYWALRAYGAGEGEIGSEPTPAEYLEALWAATAEMMRVLKPTGSCFVDLGDKYAGQGGGAQGATSTLMPHRPTISLPTEQRHRGGYAHGAPAKSLMLLPERYRVGAVDRLGLIARAVIVWDKPNGLPESVTDRVRRSHEDWVHLVKQPRYYSATDEVREPYSPEASGRRALYGQNPGRDGLAGLRDTGAAKHGSNGVTAMGVGGGTENPLGKLPGSVWTIASEPLRLPEHLGVQHYACVDPETEILTVRGWLRHDELKAGDTVAGYNLDTGLAEWTDCLDVHRYSYSGEMVAVETRDLSMRLTPNHRCVVQRAHTRAQSRGPVHIAAADQLDRGHFIPRSADWAPSGKPPIDGTRMAAIIGWVASEGWYQGTKGVYLSQSASVNKAQVDQIDLLVSPAKRTDRTRLYNGRPWTETVWRLNDDDAFQVRLVLDGKLLPWSALTWSTDERTALLRAFIAGDGHTRGDRIAIFQKHAHNLEVLQAVAVTLGYKTTLRRGTGRYVLYLTTGGRSITLRGTAGSGSRVYREHYEGTVWCPETGTGTFIARRNGSVFITGNSFPSEWPRRLILGWSPPGICLECGQGRVPVVERTEPRPSRDAAALDGEVFSTYGAPRQDDARQVRSAAGPCFPTTRGEILGYACSCTPFTDHPGTEGRERNGQGYATETGRDAHPHGGVGALPRTGPWREYHLDGWKPPPTRPAIILDPFSGTGTVAMVARALGRIGVGVDLSRDYCRAARWRVKHDGGKAISRTNLERQGALL